MLLIMFRYCYTATVSYFKSFSLILYLWTNWSIQLLLFDCSTHDAIGRVGGQLNKHRDRNCEYKNTKVLTHQSFMFCLENGKYIQWFIETYTNIYGSIVYKAIIGNSNKLESQLLDLVWWKIEDTNAGCNRWKIKHEVECLLLEMNK